MPEPVGEANLVAYLEEAARTASDLEQRIHVFESYNNATNSEPHSLQLWLARCNYFWLLWENSHGDVASDWAEEERMLGQDLFTLEAALQLWQQGYQAVQYRISDSHEFWNRWIELEIELLRGQQTAVDVERITILFKNRLATPHITWDETSQRYSTFLSEFNNAAWESGMQEATSVAQEGKMIVAARDKYETALSQAVRSGDTELQKSTMLEYLDWEVLQCRINRSDSAVPLLLAEGLFARALCRMFADNEVVWYDYAVFKSSATRGGNRLLEAASDALRRALAHCPWSGRLWSRHMQILEEKGTDISDIVAVKDIAKMKIDVEQHGMENLMQVYEALGGALKRYHEVKPTATEDIQSTFKECIREVQQIGKKYGGKAYHGDPKFRLERVFIQFLSESAGAADIAREHWQQLARKRLYGDNYDFWLQYYKWEMQAFLSSSNGEVQSPTEATNVLRSASKQKMLDWPEKILELYIQHCNDYESPGIAREALDDIYRVEKGIKKRREREEQEKAAAYAAYYGTQATQATTETATTVIASPSSQKRKHDGDDGVADDASTTKRQKKTEDDSQADATKPEESKRDRENSTIVVTNLPADVTQTKVRQYFKEYGHIKNITAMVHESDGSSTTALIEFNTPSEAESALLRDMKYFGESQIRVESGHDLTVYVANYPPAANDEYIRKLFKDCGEILSIRWPSLKVNTHRRFCYISFRDRHASAKAVQKDGLLLDEKFKLLAKYSDPGQKKNREGALSEGREIHISNLDSGISEESLKDIFSKYGKVLRVNLPKNMSGRIKGFAFMDFETRDQAELAIAQLHNTKIRSQIIQVQLSKDSKVKHTSTTTSTEHQEAGPDGHESSGPSAQEVHARTIVVLGFPDTVNDARIRAVVEPMGEIVRLVLIPGNGGAKIEFKDASTAGKAALQLDNMDFEGYTLRIGSIKDLHEAKAENREPQKPKPAAFAGGLMPSQASRNRPSLRGGKRRGGLATGPRVAGAPKAGGTAERQGPVEGAKSNADFKALFLASKDKQPGE